MNKFYQPQPQQQQTTNFFTTPIPGLLYFQAEKHSDERGFFAEIVKLPELEKALGHQFQIKQVNHARSKTNVVRGMHAEGWNKLVAVTNGLIFSAIADIRPDSPTYKQTLYFKLGTGLDAQSSQGSQGSQKLDQKTYNGLYIPQGLANSVCVLKGPADYIYFVDKLYQNRDKAGDRAISLFDPELAIDWPLSKKEMIISKRDESGVNLADLTD